MEIHQLRYFRAVARTGSFTRAAEQEHVSQPSLSQQVIKLEDELGTRLFDRLGRQVRLTESGRLFLPKAEAILRQIGDAKQEVQELAGGERGQVNLGAIPTIAPYFLPARLAGFLREHPAVQVNVVEEFTAVLLERLREGALDLALLALPVPGEELVALELLREPLYVVVPTRHRLAGQRSATLRQIEGEPFLLLKEGHCFRDNVLSACRRARLKMNVAFESGQFSTILAMVGAGVGVSVVPTMAVTAQPGCRFIPLADERSHRRVGVVRHRHHYLTRAQAALIEHLRRAQRGGAGAAHMV